MKVLKFFALQLMLTLVLLPAAQGQQDTTRPRVAVVLSGGGAKGVAHIGALKVIEEAGIPVDIVCGTSMGSLIGGLYAIGWNTDELDSLVRVQDWPMLLTDRENPAHLTLEQRHWLNSYAIQYQVSTRSLPKPMGGLIRGDNLELLFTKLCTGYLDSMDFNTLPIPYACVATNIVDNSEVVFHSGSLRQAMRASMAIPGVFTPVRLDSMVLVDGGLRNNYPADVAREMGADIVIGVTVQGDPLDAEKLDNAMNVFTQIIDINCKNKYDANIASSDVVANVCVKGYSAASFTPEAVDTLLRRGEEAMRLHWDELLALRRSAGIDSVAPRHIGHPVLPEEEVRKGDPSRLSPLVMAGFRFDTEEMGALQIGGSIPVRGKFPMRVDLNMRLGQRMAAGVQISTPKTVHTALAYTFQRNALDIYTAGDRSYSVKYRHHQAEVIPLNLKLSRFVMQLGARWDYYNYYGRILTAGEELVDLTSEHYYSLHLGLMQNNEDHWYFPTRGSRFSAAYFYRTDNLIGMDGKPGISDAAASWRVSLPLTNTFTLQPMAYSRLLFGGAIPLAYRNGIGGEWYGHYVEQQMPFAGIGHLELTERFFAGVQLQAQQRVGKNHYVLARVAVGLQDGDFEDFLGWPDMFGMQLGYSYNTILGPLDVRLGWSDMTHELYFYLNLGHEF